MNNNWGPIGRNYKDKMRLGARPYRCYAALLTQSSTSAPSLQVIDNTLNGTPVAAYSSTGVYTLTLADAFTAGKTVCVKLNPNEVDNIAHTFTVVWTSANVITINTFSGTYATAANGVLTATPIEIRVYN